jgi:methionyl-tRNA formyltransferase
MQLPTPFDTLSPSHLLLTASFGHIIPDRILALFADENALNVHPSLLPRYRGAAPIQWTIANGDKETGVSVQRLVQRRRGIDAGHLIGTVEGIVRGHLQTALIHFQEVPGDANYWSLLPKLAEEGGTLLVDVLRRMQAGTVSL